MLKYCLVFGIWLSAVIVGVQSHKGLALPALPALPIRYACLEIPVQAVCRLQPNPSLPIHPNLRGVVIFTQITSTCYGIYPLRADIIITGLPADGNTTNHGFHVHTSDNITTCEATGDHYNPFGAVHGSSSDVANRRHVGDFGNVVKDPSGNIQAVIFDNLASLFGQTSILRRGVVLHELQDDLGRGGNDGSSRTGNAGRRLACCIVEPL